MLKKDLKKLFIILASVLLAFNAVSWLFNHAPKYDSLPVEVQTTWRVDDKQDVYLDVSITNKSNRTIDELEGVHFAYAYDNEHSLLSKNSNIIKSLLSHNEKIKKGETHTISLSAFKLSDDINLIECNFYVTWVGFTFYEWGFGSRVQGGNDIWLESNSGSLRFHSEFIYESNNRI